MNCQSCNTNIDYKFLTNCAQCGRAVDPTKLQQLAAPPELPSVESGNKPSNIWKHRVLNLWYVLTASVVGMISGAVVLYFTDAIIFMSLSGTESSPGENCARGMAIAWLSILSGAFFGTIGGTAFAIEHPIGKPTMSD